MKRFFFFTTILGTCAFFLAQNCQRGADASATSYADLPRPDADHGAIQLPPDFGALVVADSLGRGRHLTVRDNGDIFVRLDRARDEDGAGLVALRDSDGDGRADIIQGFGLGTGAEVRLYDDYVYYSSNLQVFRQKLSPGELLPDPKVDTMITFPDSTARGHSSKSFTFDGQGNIYVNIGSLSNACEVPLRTALSPGADPCFELPARAAIWKFDANKPGQVQDDGAPYAIGIRNTVGLDWNFSNDKLYAMQHGRDDLHRFWPDLFTPEENRELPAEEFLLVEEGDDYGWPYCYWDQFQEKKLLAPEYGGDGKIQGRCEGIKPPLVGFPGHWGPNDMLFYTGDLFPERYKHGAFIAFHGSWNRLDYEQAGFNVAFVPMRDGRPSGEWEIFATGFVGASPVTNPGRANFRPCGLAQGPDGSLYVVDSQQGRVWRIMYYGPDSGVRAPGPAALAAGEATTDDETGPALTGRMAAGQEVYNTYCRACHMDDGGGVAGLNPPLKGTDWVTGDKTRLIRVILEGLSEVIEIDGQTYQNAMAAHNFLTDQQIADVLTYLRQSFGNDAGPLTPEEVATVRAGPK